MEKGEHLCMLCIQFRWYSGFDELFGVQCERLTCKVNYELVTMLPPVFLISSYESKANINDWVSGVVVRLMKVDFQAVSCFTYSESFTFSLLMNYLLDSHICRHCYFPVITVHPYGLEVLVRRIEYCTRTPDGSVIGLYHIPK